MAKPIPFQKALKAALVPEDAELLTVADCSRVMRRSLMQIYVDIRRGRLKAVRFNRAIRIRRSAVEAFIAAHEVRS